MPIWAMGKADLLDDLRAVKARYCRFLDTKDWDGLADLFTADAVLDVREDTGNPPLIGREAVMAQIKAAVIEARTAHQVHSPEITILGEDAAEAIWAMQDRVVWNAGRSPLAGVASITGYGHYHEHYVRQEGRWRIASLKLTRLHVDMHPG